MEAISSVALELIALLLTAVYLVHLLYTAWCQQMRASGPSSGLWAAGRAVKLSLDHQHVWGRYATAPMAVSLNHSSSHSSNHSSSSRR